MAKFINQIQMRVAMSSRVLCRDESTSRARFGCGPEQQKSLHDWKEHIADLILKKGIGIDECSEKFDTHPMAICKLMGWI